MFFIKNNILTSKLKINPYQLKHGFLYKSLDIDYFDYKIKWKTTN